MLEGAPPDAEISCTELFGPVTILYRVRDLDEAIALVNDSPYGLTAAIHTASLHRAMRFAEKVQAGVVVVNGGHARVSEPHMGFGGVKQSGHRLARGRDRGARRLHRVEVRQPDRRSSADMSEDRRASSAPEPSAALFAVRLVAVPAFAPICVAAPDTVGSDRRSSGI